LDALIPPTGGRGRAAQELNKEGARLRLLARLAYPLIKERMGTLWRKCTQCEVTVEVDQVHAVKNGLESPRHC